MSIEPQQDGNATEPRHDSTPDEPQQAANPAEPRTEDNPTEPEQNSNPDQDWKPSERLLEQNNLIHLGLIGVSIVFTQPFISAPPDNMSGFICVFAFAAAIPLLAALGMINQMQGLYRRLSHTISYEVVRSGGICFACVGVIAAFWHMSWIAGTIALASGVIGFIFYSIESGHPDLLAAYMADDKKIRAQKKAQRRAEARGQQPPLVDGPDGTAVTS